MPCLTVFHVPHRLLMVLATLALLSFAACQSPVTSGRQPVASEALATAARTVHMAEVAMVVAADGLTAGFKNGLIKHEVLDAFQSQVAPRIAAALATTRVAIKTANDAPGSAPIEVVIRAVVSLQSEVTTLQGFWMENALIVQQGVAK